ncbi:MAG: 3-hydroxybutyryl-CoA dehydrogenase [Alphaproteobacteria bacterium]|nr:3-hydroxybutyryl-CoA dehydrogenase [Alphaproteobacteria bacterium]
MVGKVGVVGAGQMGHGVAQVCAVNGMSVVLVDVQQSALNQATALIEQHLDRLAERGVVDQSTSTAAKKAIVTTTDFAEIADCEVVVETAAEDEEIKRKVFARIAEHLNEEAWIGTNTSSISITRLATASDRPDRFIGMHFMNPAPAMKLVEVIRGLQTSEETFEKCTAFAASLHKTVAVAEDFPAFIVNRILAPMINEAVYTLYEGVGSVTGIDNAMKLGANHPLGPLELADFIGLDTCLAIMQVLYNDLADSKYRPCPLLVKYVEAGWLGRKTGRGFYDYSSGAPVPTR